MLDETIALESQARAPTKVYRKWFLLLLILVYASSFIDRIIIAVVGQSIKVEMNLTDLQLGLLGGLAFSIFYSVLGIPIARLGERYNRVTIISISIIAWSAMTALCGTASTFGQLLLYRLGVGVGEAGSTPMAHSLIADQFPEGRRATALSIYALGPPLGVIAGALGGGWIAQHLGWRPAFLVFGLPGLILGCLTYMTLREPKRGGADTKTKVVSTHVPPIKEVIRLLMSSKTFVQMLLGTVTGSFAQFGINLFIPIYLNRVFGMSYAQAGLIFGLVVGIGGILGNTLGGFSADWASSRDRRWYAWVPALGAIVGFPLAVLALMQHDWMIAMAFIFGSTIMLNVWNGPTFAIIQGLVEPRMRATASAFVFLLMNLVGQGGGPAFIGFLSDKFAAHYFAGGNYQLACSAVRAHGTNGGAAIQGHLAQACATASATGVRYAMLAVTIVLAWSALHYFLASRTIQRK